MSYMEGFCRALYFKWKSGNVKSKICIKYGQKKGKKKTIKTEV